MQAWHRVTGSVPCLLPKEMVRTCSSKRPVQHLPFACPPFGTPERLQLNPFLHFICEHRPHLRFLSRLPGLERNAAKRLFGACRRAQFLQSFRPRRVKLTGCLRGRKAGGTMGRFIYFFCGFNLRKTRLFSGTMAQQLKWTTVQHAAKLRRRQIQTGFPKRLSFWED